MMQNYFLKSCAAILLSISLVSICWAGIDFATDDFVLSTSGVVTAYPFSITCWFKVPDTTNNYALVSIVDKDSTTNRCGLWAQGGTAGDPLSTFAEGSTSALTTTGYTANVWYFATAVYNNATSRVCYLNAAGKGTNTNDDGSTNPAGFDAVNIGRFGDSTPSSYTTGQITEVTIWNVALTDADVLALYDAGIKGHSLQIKSGNINRYYPMDDQPSGSAANGDTVRDVVNGNNGTGDDGADNAGLTWTVEDRLSYPPPVSVGY